MKMRIWSLPACAALAVLAVGCGGGGGGSAGLAPSAPLAPPATQSAGRFVLSIPNTTGSSGRDRKAISPGAVSISISVTGLAPQIADISSTSPLCTSSSSGRVCTIPVQAAVGTDTFTVTLFDGPNATGNKLSTGTAQATVTPGLPFSVTITLTGVIASLQFIPPGSGSSGGGTGTGTGSGPGASSVGNSSIGPPVGQPISGLGTVIAKDASGNVIVGQYTTPITITSSNASVSVTPSTLNNSGPITFSYDGVATNAITLTATAGTVSTTFTVTPSTNVIYYRTPTVNPLFIFTGPDGKLYMGEAGPRVFLPGGALAGAGPGKIARFDPVTKTFTGEVGVGNFPIGMAWAPDGSLFEANIRDNPGSVGHITGFSSYTAFPVPTAGALPRNMVLGPDGNMWFTELQRNGKIAKFAPGNPAAMTEYLLPANAHAQGLAVGADGNLYVTDSFNGAVDQVTTSGSVTQFSIPGSTPFPGLTVFPRFITAGSDGNLWITDLGDQNNPGVGATLWKMTPTGAFTKVSLLGPSSGADTIVQGPNNVLYFLDLYALGIGTVTTSGAVTEWPLAQSCASLTPGSGNGLTLAPDGSAWFTGPNCNFPPDPPAGYLGHLILAAGWTVFPLDEPIALSTAGQASSQSQLLGIAESGDSSPFTVTSSNPSVASVSTTASSHNFLVTGKSNGNASITITDAHNNTVVKDVVVTTASATIQSVTRRAP